MKNKNIEVGSIVEVVNRVVSKGQAKCRIIGQDLNGHVMKVVGILEHRNAYLLVRDSTDGPSGGYEVDENNVLPWTTPVVW
jgi:hypothetical protein